MNAKKATTKGKKFLGLRIELDRAEQLQDLADRSGISLNELCANILTNANDPNPEATTVTQVEKSLDVQGVKGDELHKKVQRLHALVGMRDHLAANREELNREKPKGVIEQFLNSERLQEWHAKSKALEEKYRKITEKIEALRDELLTHEIGEQAAAESAPADTETPEGHEAAEGNGGFLAQVAKSIKEF